MKGWEARKRVNESEKKEGEKKKEKKGKEHGGGRACERLGGKKGSFSEKEASINVKGERPRKSFKKRGREADRERRNRCRAARS